jgi:VanZ family protein
MAKIKINSILFTILFAILIFILSIMPTNIHGEPPSFYFKGMDKFIHGAMYGTLAMLVLNEYLKKRSLKFWPIFLLIIITWAYSILMELLQYFFIEYRSGDFKDALANIIGILVGVFFLFLLRRIRIKF